MSAWLDCLNWLGFCHQFKALKPLDPLAFSSFSFFFHILYFGILWNIWNICRGSFYLFTGYNILVSSWARKWCPERHGQALKCFDDTSGFQDFPCVCHMPNLGRDRPGQFITRNPPVFTKGKKNENELKIIKGQCSGAIVQTRLQKSFGASFRCACSLYKAAREGRSADWHHAMNETSKHDLSTNNVINVFHSGGTLAAVRIWTDFRLSRARGRSAMTGSFFACTELDWWLGQTAD